MNIITSAFLAARPKTLTASLIPVWAGCMVVQKLTGHWDVRLALLTFASCLCIQIACNFFNDAIDHAKHADTERRTGPRPHDGQRSVVPQGGHALRRLVPGGGMPSGPSPH